jgi:uncharacterized RDD family membrane protein YckC
MHFKNFLQNIWFHVMARGLSFLIDAVLIMVLFVAIRDFLCFLYIKLYQHQPGILLLNRHTLLQIELCLVSSIFLLYFWGFESSNNLLGTPGKNAFNIAIVSDLNHPIPQFQILKRNVFKLLILVLVYVLYTQLSNISHRTQFTVLIILVYGISSLLGILSQNDCNPFGVLINHVKMKCRFAPFLLRFMLPAILLIGGFGYISRNYVTIRSKTWDRLRRRCFSNQRHLMASTELYCFDKHKMLTISTKEDLITLKNHGYISNIPNDPGQPESEHNYRSDTHGNIWCTVHGTWDNTCIKGGDPQCMKDINRTKNQVPVQLILAPYYYP